MSLSDVQQLYKQWQDGKLLDVEERKALRARPQAESAAPSFAELLKRAGDTPTS